MLESPGKLIKTTKAKAPSRPTKSELLVVELGHVCVLQDSSVILRDSEDWESLHQRNHMPCSWETEIAAMWPEQAQGNQTHSTESVQSSATKARTYLQGGIQVLTASFHLIPQYHHLPPPYSTWAQSVLKNYQLKE